jgi:hypothetical protein
LAHQSVEENPRRAGGNSGNEVDTRMMVQFQTAGGKIKKYNTIYGVGGGEYGPEKYVSNCGREWKIKPKKHEECDHLELCNIRSRRIEEGRTKGLYAHYCVRQYNDDICRRLTWI